ncbi:MAG: hypothetical protein ACYCSW_01120 [bacterium]
MTLIGFIVSSVECHSYESRKAKRIETHAVSVRETISRERMRASNIAYH